MTFLKLKCLTTKRFIENSLIDQGSGGNTTWDRAMTSSISGVLSQATKNKTYTLKNIYSSASKDRFHGKYLA